MLGPEWDLMRDELGGEEMHTIEFFMGRPRDSDMTDI